ncbi:MAG: bifunctional glutamate N-acetyltransferase/amino-acid acetyltransferase ArgJ [Actinobacteria bacterium]|nr:bifunctional glutamate N-acetyltransferase/amino-acid acetyltransferase ArgJ [Actinomycetota bacterium]
MKWPEGFLSAATSCGLYTPARLDLGLLVSADACHWAGVFTQNAAAAPTVHWSRKRIGIPARAILVNSGNANACTGEGGVAAVEREADAVAAALGCAPDEVLIASTGPIGVPLPVEAITGAVPGLLKAFTTEADGFSEAILTSDTRTKTSIAHAGESQVVGVAKGAAMLAPNMATMLAFITTDARVDDLQDHLSEAVAGSFNRISVDACESTNDSVFLMASGKREVDTKVFIDALGRVCSDLAEQMVRDAEGSTKLIRIQVDGARDEATGVALAKAVASSALWRAAAHGGDPNWGRVASALGAEDRGLSFKDVSIAIGATMLFHEGEPQGAGPEAAREMQGSEIVVHCKVGSGPTGVEVLAPDLSPAYVEMNAEGST